MMGTAAKLSKALSAKFVVMNKTVGQLPASRGIAPTTSYDTAIPRPHVTTPELVPQSCRVTYLLLSKKQLVWFVTSGYRSAANPADLGRDRANARN